MSYTTLFFAFDILNVLSLQSVFHCKLDFVYEGWGRLELSKVFKLLWVKQFITVSWGNVMRNFLVFKHELKYTKCKI